MRRREFAKLVAATVSWPMMAGAQQRMPVIGFLNSTSLDAAAPNVAAFREGLREAGFAEGQRVAIEYRWAEGNYERLPDLAADLVGRNVDVIAASGGDRSAIAAKRATSTIPIVAVIGGDPVKAGLVQSLSRPGGNLTGVSFLTAELMPKRLELLLELVPDARSVVLLVNPENPQTESVIHDVEAGAQSKGVQLVILRARTKGEIDDAVGSLAKPRGLAMVIQADPFFNSRREQLIALASRTAVPAIYEWRGFPVAGGLISYGTSLAGVYLNVGLYVGKILNGSKPADLPVMQPTTFELVINLKTAKALGLTVPQSLLIRADEVIE